MDDVEEWRDIPGYEGRYRVSSMGRVFSINGKRSKLILLKPRGRDGYARVGLWRESVCKNHYVHRLVLLAFKGLDERNPHACHIDGDKMNNQLSNLYWGTPATNAADMISHGRMARGEVNGLSKLKESDVLDIRFLLQQGASRSDISKAFGISPSTVGQIFRKESWRHLL